MRKNPIKKTLHINAVNFSDFHLLGTFAPKQRLINPRWQKQQQQQEQKNSMKQVFLNGPPASLPPITHANNARSTQTLLSGNERRKSRTSPSGAKVTANLEVKRGRELSWFAILFSIFSFIDCFCCLIFKFSNPTNQLRYTKVGKYGCRREQNVEASSPFSASYDLDLLFGLSDFNTINVIIKYSFSSSTRQYSCLLGCSALQKKKETLQLWYLLLLKLTSC